MKQTVNDLKSQLQANDAAKVKGDAEQLEKTWQTFEGAVKAKSPDLYENWKHHFIQLKQVQRPNRLMYKR